ncbi:Plasmodium vivax Vir protein, putative [Plasmodium vivax]|uniref:Vir protein, putative n=1 Tax=Plasmodium vivax TaxID=5855 RepID=A0A1G4E9E1_PLAVI|nr:Plasmodium vivax Vir protein, putative [Plasmodium vivax]
MSCIPQIKNDSYDFFEKLENYINKANGDQSEDASGDISSNCENFSKTLESSFKNKQIAKNVCEELIKLYKSLNNIKSKSTRYNDYKNECGFFNYLVNFKLNKIRFNESVCIDYIYNAIDSQFTGSDFYNMFDVDVIYDITKDELDKMNILYSLYEKYSKLKSIIDDMSQLNKESLLTHSTACCPDYIEANYMCKDGNDDNYNNSQFCIQLEKFKTKYEGLYTKVHTEKPELSDNLIKLEECPNTKIITTAVTGSIVGLIPLLGILYKFTPMGQVLRSKIGILNNNISNNEEDKTKMSLMDQENEQFRFQQGTYNIKYQSL